MTSVYRGVYGGRKGPPVRGGYMECLWVLFGREERM